MPRQEASLRFQYKLFLCWGCLGYCMCIYVCIHIHNHVGGSIFLNTLLSNGSVAFHDTTEPEFMTIPRLSIQSPNKGCSPWQNVMKEQPCFRRMSWLLLSTHLRGWRLEMSECTSVQRCSPWCFTCQQPSAPPHLASLLRAVAYMHAVCFSVLDMSSRKTELLSLSLHYTFST